MPTLLFGSLARRPLLMVALLTAVLLAALPAVASAQPLPPRQLWGTNDSVTVGGAPWDGSQIDVINEAGDVVATVERESTSWSVEIPNDAGSAFRFRASNGGVSEVYRIDPGVVDQVFMLVIGGAPGERPTREVSLRPGFNFIVWTGHTQAIDDALETFPDTSDLTAIFEYDAQGQRWRSYRPGLPAFAQGISDLGAGVPYYILVQSALDWEMPSDGDLAGTRTIAAGFTAIGWAGPDATPQEVLDAVANAGAVTSFFRFNAAEQRYESYRPGLPAFAQGIRAINAFDVLFMRASTQTSITQ